MSKEKLEPMTKERFEELKLKLEKAGYGVLNKYRKGTTTLKLEPIILGERKL